MGTLSFTFLYLVWGDRSIATVEHGAASLHLVDNRAHFTHLLKAHYLLTAAQSKGFMAHV